MSKVIGSMARHTRTIDGDAKRQDKPNLHPLFCDHRKIVNLSHSAFNKLIDKVTQDIRKCQRESAIILRL